MSTPWNAAPGELSTDPESRDDDTTPTLEPCPACGGTIRHQRDCKDCEAAWIREQRAAVERVTQAQKKGAA